jgi:hypothetical protein
MDILVLDWGRGKWGGGVFVPQCKKMARQDHVLRAIISFQMLRLFLFDPHAFVVA